MSERLSTEQREALEEQIAQRCRVRFESPWPGQVGGHTTWVEIETLLDFITARLADRDALGAAVEALAEDYHEDAQAEVMATPASLARRAVYLRVSRDLRGQVIASQTGES
jgi:hypothetical protein